MTEPGKSMKRAPRAPAYSRRTGSFRPTWESSPASSAVWISGDSPGVWLSASFTLLAAWRSWPTRSCHSRTRRWCRYSAWQRLRNWLEESCELALAHVAPEVEQREEVGELVGEAGVELVGLRLLVGGPLARVLDRERGGDHDDLLRAVPPLGLEDHPAEPRVDRELREPAAELA